MLENESLEKFSPDQLQSLDWTRSIAIRANAGSGKTSVLIQRIVQILHEHQVVTLDQIVAITFTRKAGAQLREKLHKALTDCLVSTQSAVWQARLDELPRCSIGTIDSLCHELLRTAIEQGMIDDLDPAFGILEGLDRNELLDLAIQRTESSTDEEVQAAWTSWLTTQGRRGLNGALRGLLNSGADPDRCSEAVGQFESSKPELLLGCLQLPGIEDALNEMKSSRSELIEQMRLALKEITTSPKSKKPSATVSEMTADLERLVNIEKGNSDLDMIRKIRDSKLFTKDGGPWKSGLVSRDGDPYFPTLHQIQRHWAKWMPHWNYDFDQPDGLDLTRQLVTLFAEAHRHFRDLCREENRYDFDFLAERVDKLLESDSNRNRLTKHHRFILVDEFQDTNELQWNIIARIAGEEPEKDVKSDKLMIVGDPQQSIYRFRGADPTVFNRIIEKIKAGNSAKLDVPTAYDEFCSSTPSTEEQRSGLMRLKKNYRSHHPTPLGLIDVLSAIPLGENYQHLEAGKTAETEFCEVVYIVPEIATDADEDEQHLEKSDGEAAAESIDPNQIAMVASELQNLRNRGFAWKDMAILLRSRNTLLVELEETLRARGIPYQLVGGIGFWQRQEVRDLVCLANALANGADELALFAVLRGPLCGLDDSELLFLSTLGKRKLLTGLRNAQSLLDAEEINWSDFKLDEDFVAALKKAFDDITPDRKQVLRDAAERLSYQGTWRERVDRLPHADLFRMALDESGAWGIYADGEDGDRKLANISLFFEEVHALEAGRPTALADLARRLKTLVDVSLKDEQAELTTATGDAVQVMTVHAAKGLEFPVVAVMGLEKKFNFQSDSVMLFDRHQHGRRDGGDSALLEKLHGFPTISFRDPEQPLSTINPLFRQALVKVERQLNIDEEARIFHVAITRAERVLILAGAGPKVGQKTWPYDSTWQNWVHDSLGLKEITAGNWPVPNTELSIRIIRTLTDAALTSDGPTVIPTFDLEPMIESPRRRTIAATALKTMLDMFAKDEREWEMRYRHHVQPHAGSLPRSLLEESTAKPSEKAGPHIGTLVHRALEMGNALPKDAKQRTRLLRAQAVALLNRWRDADEPGSPEAESASAEIDAIVATAERILKEVIPNNPFRPLLEADGQAEVDFRIAIADWIITGRFDRLIRRNGSWEIVDWKTDDSSVSDIVEKYIDQMKLYALALLRSLPDAERPGRIVVHLAMTHHHATKIFEFGAMDLERYGEELGRQFVAIDRRKS